MSIEPQSQCLLLVDDEANVLAALQRLFRRHGYETLTAQSGDDALEVLAAESRRVDVILSDMRMPGMRGSDFLKRAHHDYPEIPRMLLTGFTELEDAAEAINEGHIFRYFNKPWDDEELLNGVKDALVSSSLRRERDALLRITEQQIAELSKLNEGLEAQVAARTHELQQTAEMYEAAYEESKRSFRQALGVLGNLSALVEGAAFDRLKALAGKARRVAARLKLSSGECEDVYHAVLLHRLGVVGLPDSLRRRSYEMLAADERAQYRDYPARSANIVKPMEALGRVAALLATHRQRMDDSGFPPREAGANPTLAQRLVNVMVEWYSLQIGLLSGQPRTEDEALNFLRNYVDDRYDRAVLDALSEVLEEAAAGQIDDEEDAEDMSVGHLRAGMIVLEDLYSKDGFLLLTRGQRLNEGLIETLRKMQRRAKAPIDVRVLDPDARL